MKTRFSNTNFNGIKMIIFLLVFIPFSNLKTFAAGGGKVNFSGSWALNQTTSKLSEGGGYGAAKMLNISQEGNVLSVVRTQTNRDGEEMTVTLKYTLDGKECDNSNNRRTSKSVASWSKDGKVLTINTTSVSERNGQKIETKSAETWELAANGKTITINQTVNSSRGERKSMLIYEKK